MPYAPHLVRRGSWMALVAPLLACILIPVARADVFHLSNGGRVDGALLKVEDGRYHIRTAAGVVQVPVALVVGIDEQDTPFAEYERRLAALDEDAPGHTALALWCGENGMSAEKRQHLLKAIELDPNYAPAREALGFVRINGLWVDGRRVITRPERPREKTPEQVADDEMRAIRSIQGQWRSRIKAIRINLLSSGIERLWQQGAAKIREIRDPLAILPLSEELSQGSGACRHLLVEMLSRFDEDEATMNLAVMALIDRHPDVRDLALRELVRRDDPRVSSQYREVLAGDNDVLLARAAEGLGRLKATGAIPELINVLKAKRMRYVEVPPRYINSYAIGDYMCGWRRVFDRPTLVGIGPWDTRMYRPEVGVYGGGMWQEVERQWVYRRVTVFRTEVREALRSITGQDFGFEVEAWQRWYEEFKQ